MPLFISNLILLDGWRRNGLAFLAGLIASLAQAPLGWFPLLWLCVPVLVLMLDSASLGQTRRGAFWPMAKVGWMFGFGFFLLTFYWLGSAFLVEADKFAWAIPIAVLILPAGLALFWAVATGFSAFFWSGSPLRILWLALWFSALEWLRGFVLTGLPWGGLGSALTSNSITMQALALVGPDSMTLFAILLFAIPIWLIAEREARSLGFWLAGCVGLLFVGQILFGIVRLSQPQDIPAETATIRLVQPNIPQAEKWKFENRSWIFNRLLALTTLDSDAFPLDAVDLVIWPESAVPFYLIEQPGALAAIAQALPQKAGLVTGALRRESDVNGHQEVYNSVYLLDSDGTVQSSYDKIHLVPFGEYLPKQAWLEAIGLEQLTVQRSGFASGTNRSLLPTERLGRLLPLVCYEVAFSSEVLSFPDNADWIVNVTNDAWFGATVGPWQHLHLARMRAVETGLPLIRVANTGISAVIDGYGRVLHQLELKNEGIVQAMLPNKLKETAYGVVGNVAFLMIWIFLVGAALSIQVKTRNNGWED